MIVALRMAISLLGRCFHPSDIMDLHGVDFTCIYDYDYLEDDIAICRMLKPAPEGYISILFHETFKLYMFVTVDRNCISIKRRI